MCCGGPCCLIFGCLTTNITIPNPEGYPTPPDKVLCPSCGEIEPAVYKKSVRTCGICFIPCCPCGSSDPYLGCSKCSFPLGGMVSEKCNSCGVSTTYNAEFCPNCGTARPGTRSARPVNPEPVDNRTTANGNGSVMEDDNKSAPNNTSNANNNKNSDSKGDKNAKSIRDLQNEKKDKKN